MIFFKKLLKINSQKYTEAFALLYFCLIIFSILIFVEIELLIVLVMFFDCISTSLGKLRTWI